MSAGSYEGLPSAIGAVWVKPRLARSRPSTKASTRRASFSGEMYSSTVLGSRRVWPLSGPLRSGAGCRPSLFLHPFLVGYHEDGGLAEVFSGAGDLGAGSVLGDLSLDVSSDVLYGELVGGYEVDLPGHIHLLEQ